LLEAFDEAPWQNFWVPGDFVFMGSDSIEDQRIPMWD